MIRKIVKEILPYLSVLNFSETVAGCVTTLSVNRPAKDNKVVIKKYPVYINTNKDVCDNSDYIALVPNSDKKSIIYFEENGIRSKMINNNLIEITANVKLIFWCNLKRINSTFTDAELLKLNIIKAIPDTIANIFPYSFVRINYIGEDAKNVSIFSKYTYNEEEKQYLIYPFDYFALNYEILFQVGKNCVEDIVISPAECL
jgi:hypothetical protein